jgi:hypothetical protein
MTFEYYCILGLTSCSLVDEYHRFAMTCGLHVHGREYGKYLPDCTTCIEEVAKFHSSSELQIQQ